MVYKTHLWILSVAIGAGLPVWAYAQPRPSLPAVTAEQPIVFDYASQEMFASGHAQVAHPHFLLEADEIRLSRKTLSAQASKNVRITQANFRLAAEYVSYAFSTPYFESGPFRCAHSLPGRYLYLQGAKLKGNKTLMTAENTAVTFYPGPADPHPSDLCLKARSLEYSADGSIVARHAVASIGSLPIFYWPYLRKDLNESLLEIKHSYGSSRAVGCFLKTTTLARLSPGLKAGLLLNYFSHRGLLYGPVAEYKLQAPLTDLQGAFRWGYIQDRGSADRKGLDLLQNPIGRHRSFIEWQHKEHFLKNRRLQLTIALAYAKDSEVLKDFYPEKSLDNPHPDTFAELVYQKDSVVLSGFTRVRANTFQPTVERLPELTFESLPSPLFEGPLYHHAKARYSRLKQKRTAMLPERLQYHCLEAHYGLHWPLVVAPYLTFTPVAATRINHYERTYDQRTMANGSATVLRGQIGFDFVGKAFSIWPYHNALWKLKNLRHILKPMVQYRYSPAGKTGSGTIPAMDAYAFRNRLEPLDLSLQRNTDTAQQQHVVRFGLQNYFHTQAAKYGSRELMGLHFFQDLRLHTRPQEDRWSDFFTTFNLTPIEWLTLKLDHYYHFKTHRRGVTTSLMLTEADAWSLALGLDYRKDRATAATRQLHQSSIAWRYHFNIRHAVEAKGTYDARAHQWIKHGYFMASKLGNHWLARYGVEFRKRKPTARKHAHEATLSFSFTCLAF